MNNKGINNEISQGINSQSKVGVDPSLILLLLFRNWYLFAIAIIFSLFAARFYINHTMPVYMSSITVLINETEDRPLVDNTELLQGLGLPGGMRNLENQMMILRSRDLTERTLKELPFDIEYYLKTWRNSLPIYPDVPVKVITDRNMPLPYDIEFSLTFLGGARFTVQSESETFQFQATASFGEDIEIAGGSFRIECFNEEWLASHLDQKIYFVHHSRIGLVNYYSNRISIEPLSRDGSMLRISLAGTNPAKDVDFLNKHIERFQSISLDKKNTEAQRRIQFIDDQLVGISDSLSITENRLQQFRSSHKVMDLSAQGQAIIGQVTLLENERARLNLEANYYDYLAEYLAKNAAGELPIVPITMGITDPGLTRLVEELAALQGQLSARGAGEMNPLQRNLEQRVRTAKDALRETLNGLRRANSLARSENQEQINRANSQASSLPVTERQLLGIERKFRLNDELYTYLLETRAEQQMQKASNRSDSEVIDPADVRFTTRISPDPVRVYFLGLFAGAGVPLMIIFLTFLFNKKLREDDIRRLTNLPVVGNIPHNSSKQQTVVFDNPNSGIAESFRLLRSRVQFFTKEEKSPVILITSSTPGEGKTFTSINLASVYSLLDKKTVLVGFDLRKPKIFHDFNLSNEKGVSTWLIGKDKLCDIIQPTSFVNLSIIAAGPVPPNPSELTALEKTSELISLLKEKFDYVIIDSSPIGIVSDTLHLARHADVCMLVVRPGNTIRDMFESSLYELRHGDIKGVSLVMNDISSASKYYGYGEKYGYTSSNRKRIKGFLHKRR
jgi:capsular exopolysaccharide synthesis family protein